MPNPTITAFQASPDRGRGLARDMRVRWALEEVGQPYDVRLVSFEAMKQPEHLALHPFGQIPTYEEHNSEGDLVLFETGSIILHIADQHPGKLLPLDPAARARAITWMFAALNTVEPPIFERSIAPIVDHGQPWLDHRLAALDAAIAQRLASLSACLGPSGWLDGDFSAGDLLMATVLLRANAFGALLAFPALTAYLARAEARPAYQRAFAAQRAVFEASSRG